MLETCAEQIKRHEQKIHNLEQTLSSEEKFRRSEATPHLLLDAIRKSSNTRDLPRRVVPFGLNA